MWYGEILLRPTIRKENFQEHLYRITVCDQKKKKLAAKNELNLPCIPRVCLSPEVSPMIESWTSYCFFFFFSYHFLMASNSLCFKCEVHFKQCFYWNLAPRQQTIYGSLESLSFLPLHIWSHSTSGMKTIDYEIWWADFLNHSMTWVHASKS